MRGREVFPAAVLGIAAFAAVLQGRARSPAEEIDLGDLAAGGDGRGTADPAIFGIHPDAGVLNDFFLDGGIGIADGMALQPVEDSTSEFIDSVFIIDQPDMPINTAGVAFSFPPEDLLGVPQTWGQILNKRIGGEVTPLAIGGVAFERGVGIHSVAGITYDLDVLREAFGPDGAGLAKAFAGVGDSAFAGCRGAGWVTAYLILSDGAEIIGSASHRTAAGGRWLALPIPPHARFLTLAAGAGTGRFYCNSGAFGDAVVTPLPPVTAMRDLPDSFFPGDTITAAIELLVNPAAPPDQAEVIERVPHGLIPSEPSAPGAVEDDPLFPGRKAVVWRLPGPVGPRTLSYRLFLPDPFPNASFRRSELRAGGESQPVFGDADLTGGSDGFLNEALAITLKQPLANCLGANPGLAALRRDYLTDGDQVTEATVAPAENGEVLPDFGGASPSPGPAGDPRSLVWTVVTGFGWLDLNAGDPDDVMSYLAFYVVNRGAAPLPVAIGSGSDDSQAILVDGRQVWIHGVERPNGAAQAQDHSPVFDLGPGKHLVLQKVFEGCGGFNSSIRFEDADRNPLLLEVTLDPSADPPYTPAAEPNPPRNLVALPGDRRVALGWEEPEAGPAFSGYRVFRDGVTVADLPASPRSYLDEGRVNGTRHCYVVRAIQGALASAPSNESCATPRPGFRRGDVNADGRINLTDAINLLAFLFLGETQLVSCKDAADTDDSGNLNITDAIGNLSFQFQGGDDPPAPGPAACGPDPTLDLISLPGSDLGCETSCP